MARRTITLFLMALLMSSVAIALGTVRSVAAETIKVYVDPPQIVDYSLFPGTSFNVSVKIDNIPVSPGLGGAQFVLTYDPALLNATAFEEVMFHNVTPPSEWDNIWELKHEINNTGGYVFYAYTWVDINRARNGGYAPIVGNHTMATITFQVKSVGECALAFVMEGARAVKLGDQWGEPMLFDAFDGYFNNIPPALPPLMIYVSPPQVGNESLGPGSTFFVAVRMDSIFVHRGVMGVQFNLTWDPAILEAVNMTEVAFHEVTPQSEWDNIWEIANRINNTGGFLLYAYAFMNMNRALSAGYAPITGNHTLALIEFRVKAKGTSVLHLTAVKAGDSDGAAIGCTTADGFFQSATHIPGDLNGDGAVDIFDAILAAAAFGSTPGAPNWNPAADLDGNGTVDIFDIIILASNFGRVATT